MTDIDPEDVARVKENLELVRQHLCVYMGPTCDCKHQTGRNADRPFGQGEVTGCPEVREGIRILTALEQQQPSPLTALIEKCEAEGWWCKIQGKVEQWRVEVDELITATTYRPHVQWADTPDEAAQKILERMERE